jgi:hypothetical protein
MNEHDHVMSRRETEKEEQGLTERPYFNISIINGNMSRGRGMRRGTLVTINHKEGINTNPNNVIGRIGRGPKGGELRGPGWMMAIH